MSIKYKPYDPFPDEFQPHQYPILEDGVVARPRLAPDLEQKLYYDDFSRSDKNSMPWRVHIWIMSSLSATELTGFMSFLKTKMPALIEKENTRDPWDPMPQQPEIMHAYLQLLIEKSERKNLKLRWGPKYKKLIDYYHFLGYRIAMRNIACARLKKEVKDRQDKILEQALSSMMMPAHVMEYASGKSHE